MGQFPTSEGGRGRVGCHAKSRTAGGCARGGARRTVPLTIGLAALSLFSTSPYAATTAFRTCSIMAHGPVISDVLNCPFLILFANSIPLNVTCAFPMNLE